MENALKENASVMLLLVLGVLIAHKTFYRALKVVLEMGFVTLLPVYVHASALSLETTAPKASLLKQHRVLKIALVMDSATVGTACVHERLQANNVMFSV
jgi:hypothetical protein